MTRRLSSIRWRSPDLGALGALLADPAVETVFHDADYDLRILHRDLGYTAANLFDTRIAAQLLNEPGIGLAALLQKHFGLTVDKKYQRADWSMRPLLAGMLEYAADDTRYLPKLRDIIRRSWRRWDAGRGPRRSSGCWSRCAGRRPAARKRPTCASRAPARCAGHQYTVLRELHEWREQAAKQLDRAPFRVLQNESAADHRQGHAGG